MLTDYYQNPLARGHCFASSSDRDPNGITMDELKEEYQGLRDENHQLQLRIMGVNVLARMLQEKNEQLQITQDKNKVSETDEGVHLINNTIVFVP